MACCLNCAPDTPRPCKRRPDATSVTPQVARKRKQHRISKCRGKRISKCAHNAPENKADLEGHSGCCAGWGGRDRTSEWRNQNPLPYRLATPQQATRERRKNRLPQIPVGRSRSIGSGAAFQPPGGAKYHRPGPAPAPLWCRPGHGPFPALPAVETSAISWEYGANDVLGSEP